MRSSRARAVPAAVLAVLLAGCGGGTASSGAVVEPSTPAGSSPSTTAPSPSPSDSSRPTASDAAGDVVLAWLDALGEGDTATAQSMLGAWSADNVEAMGGLEAMASGLAEGMAQFRNAASWSSVPVPGHDGAFLVTASGQITREGSTEADARAWLVHPEDGRDVVEAFGSGALPVVAPTDGTLGDRGAVEVVLASGTPVTVLDGEPLASGVTVEPAGDGKVRVTVLPEGGWGAGPHVVSVATVPEQSGGDGPWDATAVMFQVG
jgi:hypothetical protein